MAAPKKAKTIPDKAIIAALRKCGGILALTAHELGSSRQNISQRVKNSKKLTAIQQEIEEETMDLGEGHIVKGVREGDKFYVNMYMTQKGKRRGYGHKVENSFDDTQIEAFVTSLGGDPAKYRAALIQFGVNPDQD